MKANRIVILALALTLPAATLLAQNDGQNDGPPPGGPGGGGGRHRPPMLPIIAALDANHDGVLTADEIANAPAALKTLDKNGDGQLTKDEYLPPRPPRGGPEGQSGQAGQGQQQKQDGASPPNRNDMRGPGARPVPPIIAALDTNGDGIISADEIANASASLMKLDKNGDGKLTMEEMMGPRPPRRGQGDGKGPDNDGPNGGDGQRPPPPDQNN